MKANTGHSALSITEDTPPDWINPEGTKWWKLSVGLEVDGTAFLAEAANGERDYVIIRDNKPIAMTKGFEQLCYEFTKLELIRKHRVGYKPRKKK